MNEDKVNKETEPQVEIEFGSSTIVKVLWILFWILVIILLYLNGNPEIAQGILSIFGGC